MRKFFSIGFVATLLVIALGATAQAGMITYNAIFTGSLIGGTDDGKHFSKDGTLHPGSNLTLRIFFNTAHYSSAGAGSVTAGVGGDIEITNAGFNGFIPYDREPSSYQMGADGIEVSSGDADVFVTANFNAVGLPGSILTPFDADCIGADLCTGSFYIIDSLNRVTNGTFNLTHATLLVIAAAPIPASLPLFASGLLGLGFVARRRRVL